MRSQYLVNWLILNTMCDKKKLFELKTVQSDSVD